MPEQHAFGIHRRTPGAFGPWIDRLDHGHQVRPRHDTVHCVEKLLAAGWCDTVHTQPRQMSAGAWARLPFSATLPVAHSERRINQTFLRFDLLVYTASSLVDLTRDWVEAEIVGRNFRFQYSDHLRKMLCHLVGESAVRLIEFTFETDYPGKLEQMKAILGMLWKSHGLLAYTHSAAPVVQQATIYAPSWTINQQRILSRSIDLYEESLRKAFSRTITMP